MDVAFLFWNHKKIGQHLLPLKVRHRNIELWIDLFKCIFWLLFSFFQLIWFILNTGMTFLFWKSFNNSPACIYFTQSASPRDWVLNCIYVSLFIHSFIHLFIFFYYYLFVSLYLIYINQVWHFLFWNRSIIASMYLLPLKCLTARLSFWIVFIVYLFIHSFTIRIFFTIIYLFHLI